MPNDDIINELIRRVSALEEAMKLMRGQLLYKPINYTISLLHLESDFTDQTGHAWTANGNAAITTAVSSPLSDSDGVCVLDGTGDYLSTPEHLDWRLDDGYNKNFWTIDCWFRYNVDPGAGISPFFQQYQDANNYWLWWINNNQVQFIIRSAAVAIVSLTFAWNPAASTWYHLALVKQGTTGYKFFVNGTQTGAIQTDTDPMPYFSAELWIGRGYNGVTNYYHNGWVKEPRLSKGVARWTSNFTPPTRKYQ